MKLPETFVLPKVSVIVPIFNGELLIRRCVDCLLHQSYPMERTEIILADNNSTDRTASIIQSFGLKCIWVARRSPGAARNAGMQIGSGEIVIFIDVDCLADPDLILHHVLAHLYFEVTNPRVKMIGGGIKGSNRNIWSVCDDFCSWSANHPRLAPGFIPFHPTANLSLRKELIDAGYYFDAELRSGEDYDFCLRVTRDGYQIYFEPKALVYHINRSKFWDLMKRARDWTQSEDQLRWKGTIFSTKLHILEWSLVYSAVFGGKVLEVLYNSVRVKRFQVIFFLPLIIIFKFYYCLLLLIVELKYNKNNTRMKGAFLNYCRQKLRNISSFINYYY